MERSGPIAFSTALSTVLSRFSERPSPVRTGKLPLTSLKKPLVIRAARQSAASCTSASGSRTPPISAWCRLARTSHKPPSVNRGCSRKSSRASSVSANRSEASYAVEAGCSCSASSRETAKLHCSISMAMILSYSIFFRDFSFINSSNTSIEVAFRILFHQAGQLTFRLFISKAVLRCLAVKA